MKTKKTPEIEAPETTVAPEVPEAPEAPMKKCNSCGEKYPATTEHWHKNAGFADGLNCACKRCKNACTRMAYAARKAAQPKPAADASEKEIFPERKRKIAKLATPAPIPVEKTVSDKIASLTVYPANAPGEIPPTKPRRDSIVDYDMLDESFGRANSTLVIDFSGHEDVLKAICAEAKKDLRLPSMQALWHLTRIPTLATKEA